MPVRLPQSASPEWGRSTHDLGMTTWNQAGGDIAELWGTTLQELFDEMDGWGLEEVGRCTWTPELSLDWDDNEVVTAARLTSGIEVLTPAWANRSDANDAVRAEWDRWSQALMTHEMGHVELAYQYLDNFEDSLVGKPKAEAWEAFEQVKRDLQAASNAYDDSNGHGVSQGTTLDVNIT
jgi:predicted secreted Zn-dependent protease